MFDVISVGDATIDTFIQIHDANIRCDLKKTDCMLCVPYGEKIPVDKLSHSVAGNAANNAVAISRLGLKTAIYVNVGSDPSGEQISQKLKEEGVDSRYIVRNDGMESNSSAVISFKGERTIFVYHQAWKYQLPELDKTRWIYLTSMAPSFVDSEIMNQIARFIQRTGTRLFYNPGTYQLKIGVKKNPQILALTEVFIVNKEEAKLILGHKEEGITNIKKLLKGLADLGPKKVIITDAANGSFGFDGESFFSLPIFPSHLVQMTGAGDAYAAGVLGGLIHGNNLAEGMRWGAANGAAVIEQVGAQVGLLNFEQMQKRLKENPKIIAKEI